MTQNNGSKLKDWIVTVWVYLPYKREYTYRIKARRVQTALFRATLLFKKEPQVKGKHYNEFSIKVIKV